MTKTRDLIKNLLKNQLFEQNTNIEIDEAGKSKYTEEDLIDSACQYKTMGDFIKNDRNKYQAARYRDILLKIRSKCKYKYVGNLIQRMVYMYIWEKNIRRQDIETSYLKYEVNVSTNMLEILFKGWFTCTFGKKI